MLFDTKVVSILEKIKNNQRNIGYTNLLKDPSVGINQTIKIIKGLWEIDLIYIENKGRKKIVHLTDKGEQIFELVEKIRELIK